MKEHFLLRPDIHYLNHGSFGACPKPVFDVYQNFQRMLEEEPLQFITKTGESYLQQSKVSLAEFINCDPMDLVYVTNPSYAMNMVIKSLHLQKGDEVLTTDHEYGAMDRTWNFYCEKSGAKYVRQPISTPIASKEKMMEEFWGGLSSNTKVIFISQITSSTALIFPIKEICQKARELGLMIIVDGAHVPGHIPLDLNDIEVDFYTGACHKWLCSPKGSSFLYAKRNVQHLLEPLIVSWGYDAQDPSDSQFQDYHQYQGTRDYSAFLTTPSCLKFREDVDWENKIEACKETLHHYYPIVAKELNSHPICPVNNTFLGQICSIPIQTNEPSALKELLYEKYSIEIPVFDGVGPGTFLRISFQPYNSKEQLEFLIDAIRDIKRTTNLIG